MQGFLKKLPRRSPAAKTQHSPKPGNLNKAEVSAPPRTATIQVELTPAPSALSDVSCCRCCYSIKAHCSRISQSRWTVPRTGLKWSIFRWSRQCCRVMLWLDRRALCCLMKCCIPYETASTPQSCLRNTEKHQTSRPDVELILCFHSYFQLIQHFFEKVNPGVWLTMGHYYYELFTITWLDSCENQLLH